MPTSRKTLLPPNATALERALDAAAARIEDVPAPLAQLWDPATCALELLPWLAWGVSVDAWNPDWTEAVKRATVAQSIAHHRQKGTPAAIDIVMAGFDELLALVEWHQTTPRGVPHTFDIVLPLIVADGRAQNGARATAAFAESLVREISRVKPLREHFRFVQSLTAETTMYLVGAARIVGLVRHDGNAAHDPSPVWNAWLQTEIGEPVQAESGALLREAA